MTTVPKPTSLANTYTAAYDAWNRVVEIKSGETVVAKFEYDGLNRRIKKHIDSQAPADPDGVDLYRHFYYNAGWQIVETRESDSENTEPDDEQLASYEYDGMHRRIKKTDKTAESDVAYDYYYNTAWQVLEKRYDAFGSASAAATDVRTQYVWDIRYIDAPPQRKAEK